MKITRSAQENNYRENQGCYFEQSVVPLQDKLDNFLKYVSRQHISRFLFREHIFRQILDVHGSVFECGVYQGNGLLTWGQLSAIYEPYNYQRMIIGFDTFEGFPDISDQDKQATDKSSELGVGGFGVKDIYDDIRKAVELYDQNRPLNHIEKIKLIKGDANLTVPQYLEDNPHTVISLLYLDFDIYKPTRTVLEYALERMPKGAIIAFDELNNAQWPGETQAVMETVGVHNLRIKRCSFEPCRSYAVIE